MLLVSLNGKSYFNLRDLNPNITTKDEIAKALGVPISAFYLLCNGKIVHEVQTLEQCPTHIVPRLVGGKGGFGSMLRAIGAQIEKTTNREACRDLSGRRLRDINEEKRLKNWINQQSEREKQAEDRRQKKLERLCQKPKHEFKDEEYDKERSALPEKVEDALEQGLKASCSSGSKRKQTEIKTKKKKAKLWLGSEDEVSSSVESDEDGDTKSTRDAESDTSTKGTDSTPQISNYNSNDNSEDGTKELIQEIINKDEEVIGENKNEEKQTNNDKSNNLVSEKTVCT